MNKEREQFKETRRKVKEKLRDLETLSDKYYRCPNMGIRKLIIY